MSRKRHAINIPGVMLDSIRDNGNYENDERFTKRQKIKGSVLNRKENRKQQRTDKKRQKEELKTQHKKQFKLSQKNINSKTKNKKKTVTIKVSNEKNTVRSSSNDEKSGRKKKRVSFSDHDDIHEIPARETNNDGIDLDFEKWELEFASDSEDSEQNLSETDEDSQDEQEEEDAHNLIEKLKELKQFQRGGYDKEEKIESEESELDEEQQSVMNQLAVLKGNKKSKDSSNIRIVKEEDLEESTDEEVDEGEEISDNEGSYDDFDDEQKEIMRQLAALKAKKATKGSKEVRIVKEDELDDDILSSNYESEEDEEEEGSEEKELDEEQVNVMDQLKSLKGKRGNKTESIKIVKEDDLDDDDLEEDDFSSTEENIVMDNTNESADDFIGEELDDEQQNIMDQLAALKAKKTPSKSSEFRIVKEDDLSDDLDESDEDDQNEEESESKDDGSLDEKQVEVMNQLAALKADKQKDSKSKIKIIKEDELDDDSLSSEEEQNYSSDEQYDSPLSLPTKDDEDIDYYAKKLGIDSNKGLKRQSEDDFVGGLFDGLEFMDNYESASDLKNNKKEKEKEKEKKEKKSKDKDRIISQHDRDMLEKDDADISYYAKKLGIDPSKGLKKQDDDDIIGGLFDGLDLDYSNDVNMRDEEDSEEDSDEESEDDDHRGKRKSENGDDDIDSDDFDDDDDLDDDDKALLKEMYGLESSDSNSDSEFDSDSEDDGPRVKENPYIAPVSQELQETAPAGSKYIPPALRKKMAMGEHTGDSEELKKLIRLIKGPFNKLSEPNISSVISELNNVYNENPRQFVNEAILKVVLQSVAISTPMLESFLVLYSSALVALYKLQGVEFGAYVIQHVVEEFEKDIESDTRVKQEVINVTGLLGYLYSLNLVSSTLIYDIIKMKLIKNPTELKTDVLLKLIRSCGSKLRSDDQNALTSIIGELSKSIKENESKGIKTSTRTRFLVDTITDLKNNRLKNLENENTTLMINRIKKQLGAINNSRNLEPIKVNLDDIENIEERGKWWLVGSAWKGNEAQGLAQNASANDMNEEVNDNFFDNREDEFLGTEETNWSELAKQCRMNTDIRRAIFISIMSAEDFMDSFMKLEKLNLKKSQKKEIPNILMHCATMESTNNPYYSYLAKKLCDDHSMRRSFQLNLWDFIKELDGDESSTSILIDSDEDQRLWKILNMGRFFGFLIGEGSLSLNVLRVVNFLTASSDVKIFLEIMLITIIDDIAKRSEVVAFGAGKKGKKSKDITYSGKIMAERVSKCDEQSLLLKGLQYFLNGKLRNSGFIKGKKQRSRIEWGIDTMSEMIAEMVSSQK